MPYKPGQSGNPGGRPARSALLAAKVRAAIEPHQDAMIARLVAVALDERTPPADVHCACRILLELAYGRAKRVRGAEVEAARERLAERVERLIRPVLARAAPDRRPDPAPVTRPTVDPLASLRALVGG